METMKQYIQHWLGIDVHRSQPEIWETIYRLVQRIEALEGELFDFKQALKAKVKESVFDGSDKTSESRRMAYIPVARRRAQAERLSLGPKNHDEKVRENNTRAIESAG